MAVRASQFGREMDKGGLTEESFNKAVEKSTVREPETTKEETWIDRLKRWIKSETPKKSAVSNLDEEVNKTLSSGEKQFWKIKRQRTNKNVMPSKNELAEDKKLGGSQTAAGRKYRRDWMKGK
jgi:hypothetical protein